MIRNPQTVSMTPAAPIMLAGGATDPPNHPSIFCSPNMKNTSPTTTRNAASAVGASSSDIMRLLFCEPRILPRWDCSLAVGIEERCAHDARANEMAGPFDRDLELEGGVHPGVRGVDRG